MISSIYEILIHKKTS